ncbi:MAG: hypothetical protein HQK95_08705 [Nitrospirae bacterium]|nr:hypothetical protein [Nitrospirota bacterium]
MNRNTVNGTIISIVIALSLYTIYTQFKSVYDYGGDYLSTEEQNRHSVIINGTAPIPYRYRILTQWVYELWRQPFRPLADKYINVPNVFKAQSANLRLDHWISWLTFRIVQNVIIFWLAFLYFRTFGLSRNYVIMGLIMLAWGISHSYHHSSLSAYTYTDIIFYLLASLWIRKDKLAYLVPLTFFAALNRETSIFIPLMLLCMDNFKEQKRRNILYLAITMSTWVSVYVGLRLVLGLSSYVDSGYGPIMPGFMLAYLNFINDWTWKGLAEMFHVLLCAVFFIRLWPDFLAKCLYFIVLPWTVLMFFFGSTSETRLFLVPLVTVFIPAGLIVIRDFNKQDVS